MSLSIGHFVIKFPSKKERLQVYGSERITHVLCKELVKLNNNVNVFVPYIKTFDEWLDGICVHFYDSITSILGYNASLEMLKKVMDFKLDVVHIHNDSPMAMFAGMRYAKKKKRPLVVTWHGDWLGATKLRKISAIILNKLLVRKCLSQADAVIVPSANYVETSNILSDFEDKIVEIPHGVNLDDLQVPYSKEESRKMLNLDEDKLIVLYLSSVCEGKGAGLLLKAASKILAEHKDILFVFVGGGKVEEFKEVAKKLGINDHVTFTGYVDETIKKLYYKSADIFVFPSMSMHEVFPVVTVESAAYGLPIVVSNLRIFKNRIKNGYNGMYFRVGDKDDLTKALKCLIEDEELRVRIGGNAQKDVEKYYNSRRMAELTYRLYLNLV